MMWIRNTDEARKAARKAREDLERTAAAGGYSNLAKIVNQIAEAEGNLKAFEYKDRMDARHMPLVTQLERMHDLMAQGAEDTWSGRENDAQRAHYDGVRAAASRIMTTMFDQMNEGN